MVKILGLKFLVTLVLIGYSGLSLSGQNIEVWFLSRMKTSFIPLINNHYLKNLVLKESYPKNFVAKLDVNHLRCELIGDEYFHPQIGIHQDGHSMKNKSQQEFENNKIISQSEGRKFISSTESSLVQCDKDYYFDLYCGRSKNEKVDPVGLEIWIDVSSSIREIDGDHNGDCYRARFLKTLFEKCNSKGIEFYTFTTSRSIMSNFASSCGAYGLNDKDRLVNWIKNYKGENLIIITDISEYTAELEADLEKLAVNFYGHELDSPIYPDRLISKLGYAKKLCKN